jgi:3-oxoacyl-[acyl-carrier-protein] synthase II
MHMWGTQGLRAMPPLWLLKYLPNMPACHVSIIHNLQGPSNTVTENDVAPLLALAEAQRIIQRGLADVMLTGGSESKVNPLSLTRMSLFARLSARNDEPARAVRPFDKNRDGTVPGEGACVLILEELEHARRRGATVLGEVVGCGARASPAPSPPPSSRPASRRTSSTMSMPRATARSRTTSPKPPAW